MACPDTEESCAAYCDGPSHLDVNSEGLWCVCDKEQMASCCTYAQTQNVWDDTEFFLWTDNRQAFTLGGWALAYIIMTYLAIFMCLVLVVLAFHNKPHQESSANDRKG